MPIPQQRDPEQTRAALAAWLAGKVGAHTVEVVVHGGPSDTGFSSDTILFDASWDGTTRSFVARAEPYGETIFPEYEIGLQYRVIAALGAGSDVPVPPVHWCEEDPAVLGAPFFVMSRVDGRAPADSPPYSMDGWLLAARPEQQRLVFESGLDALARVHACDHRALGLAELERPHLGLTPGLEQQLAYYERYYEWAAARGRPVEVIEAARDWCRAHRPDDDDRVGLCWGDARIGNILFGPDFRVAAVVDWEMVTLANPVMDLAWYLFFQWHWSDGVGVPDLPGFPRREESIARWEAATGRRAEHFGYYEVFAAYRFAIIMMRVVAAQAAYGLMPADTTLDRENLATLLLTSRLQLG